MVSTKGATLYADRDSIFLYLSILDTFFSFSSSSHDGTVLATVYFLSAPRDFYKAVRLGPSRDPGSAPHREIVTLSAEARFRIRRARTRWTLAGSAWFRREAS